MLVLYYYCARLSCNELVFSTYDRVVSTLRALSPISFMKQNSSLCLGTEKVRGTG